MEHWDVVVVGGGPAGAACAAAARQADPGARVLVLDRRLPRVPQPCALVVFGITGDLARKKLLPAVYDLANRGLLPT
ncbi:NAD(P)-binding protein, partial [Blastococcus sp. CT_GayMR16]|uniref:NAD(P)-binding protein n=1 Tax=Blastococcus sp. CT_GayMR16 TaxID=2559607 RepID=UPI00107437F4